MAFLLESSLKKCKIASSQGLSQNFMSYTQVWESWGCVSHLRWDQFTWIWGHLYEVWAQTCWRAHKGPRGVHKWGCSIQKRVQDFGRVWAVLKCGMQTISWGEIAWGYWWFVLVVLQSKSFGSGLAGGLLGGREQIFIFLKHRVVRF